ncbi:tape measure protein [Gordonia soli]|uniref:Putative phage tail tape measure protein n=1 Tax=Gordonia soli NBRC 108243 TaxID=1223545 RepID=M0QRE6_9ACTN|nr:tape measure protein [Gordonia soli]GAC71034.1 putative phage tail tape measure protein [Gordonia soli NBRC 108243]
MATSVVYVPVASSMKGFTGPIIKEASGAGKRASAAMSAEFEAGGKKAGQSAAAGLASQKKEIERVSAQIASARKDEADAAGNVRVKEQQLQELRDSGSATAAKLAKAEEDLARARRTEESAQSRVATGSQQLERIRSGEATTARTIIRAEDQLRQSRNQTETAAGQVRVAEVRLQELRDSGKATQAQLAQGEERVAAAERNHAAATDTVRSRELLLASAQQEAAQSAQTLARDADRAGDSVEKVGDKADHTTQRVGGMGSRMASMLKVAGGAAMATAGATIATAFTKGFTRLKAIDDASAKLKGLGHDAQTVSTIMQSANAAVKGTAFGLDEAATSAAGAVAAGIKPGQELTKYLTLTGDAATIAGTSMSEMGSIFNKVATSNKIQGDVIAQLSDAGIPIVQLLGKELGKTGEEVVKLASEGKINFAQFQSAMQSGLGGAALESGKSFSGGLKNVMAALGRLGATILGPVFQRLPGLFDAAIPKIDAFGNTLKGAGRSIQDVISFVREWAPAFTVAAVALGSLTLGMLAFNLQQKIAAAGGFLKWLKTFSIATRGAAVAQVLFNSALWSSPITWIVAGIAAVVAGLVLFFTKTEVGRKVWAATWGAIKTAAAATWGFLKGVFSAIGSAVGTVIGFVRRFWQILVFGLGPIGIIIGVVTQLIKHWDMVKAVFSAVWGVVRPIISGFMTAVKILGAIVGTIIGGTILVAWNLMKTTLQVAWNTVINPMFQLFMAGIRLIGTVATWVWTSILAPAFNGIKLAVQYMWAGVGVVFGLFQAGWNLLGTGLAIVKDTVIMPIWNAVKTGAQFMLSGIQVIFGWLSAGWNLLATGLRVIADTVITPVWNAVKAGAGLLWNGLRTIFDWIKGGWNLLGTGIRTVIDTVITPAWEGMKAGLGRVRDFFGTVVDGIKTAWDKVKGFVATPINFVINTVWNNGLLKAWNTIAGFLPGLKQMSPLAPVAFAEGGPVPMSQGAKRGKDSVHALMMPGEHVWDVMDVVRAGGQRAMYAMRSLIERGIPFTWDAARGVASLPAGSQDAIATAPRGADMAGFLRAAGIPGYKTGGEVRPAWEGQLENGHLAAKSRNGNPYTWGNEDCSGYMSMIADAIINGGRGVRRWATSSFPGGQPWKPGLGKGFSVGVNDDPGGPGGGHTSGTLTAVGPYATVNVESGGAHGNVAYGGPAAGADDAQWNNAKPGRFHLGIGADGAFESAGGPSAAEQGNVIKRKIKEILDKALDPIKQGMTAAIGAPPPEWLGIPPKALTITKDKAVDATFDVVGKLGSQLRAIYDKAKDITTSITSVITNPLGLFRDKGGYLPKGLSVVRNETGRPEAVLNWKQLEEVRKLVDSTSRAAGESILGDTLDFFGFKKLYDAISGAVAPKEQATQQQGADAARAGTSGAGDSTAQGKDSTTAGGAGYADPTYGTGATFQQKDTPLTTKMPNLGEGSDRYSFAITEQAKNMGLPKRAAIIGNATALVEVGDPMKMYANTGNPESLKLPHDAVGSDHDSVGLFQQRDSWGSTADRMDPHKSAALFYNALKQVGGWESMDMGAAAQAVQRSAFPDRYAQKIARATALVDQAALYDAGGWLKTGLSMIANKTGRPEAILTAPQWASIDSMLEELPSAMEFKTVADMAAGNMPRAPRLDDIDHGGSQDGPRERGPLVYVENQYTHDPAEAARETGRELRRAARSDSLVGGW